MRTPLGILIMVAVTGCNRASSGWTITEGRTAAGVPHIANTPPASGIEPTWTIEPELRIGTVEGDGPELFGTIKGLLVLSDERVAVLDADAQEIRIFGKDGKHLRTFGRKGAGPGELSEANGLALGRDGIIRVNDPANSRLSFFHPDSGFVTSVSIEVHMFGYLWRAVMDTADHLWEDGLIIRDNKSIYVLKGYQPNGQWTDTIVTRTVDESFFKATSTPGYYSKPMGAGTMTVPYWPTPVSTRDPRRAIWSKPSQENDYRIVRTTLNGDTTLILESRRTAVPVTQAERDSAIASARRWAKMEFDWSQIPDSKPIVRQLFLSSEGDVWVRVTAAGDSLVTYDVFGDNGRYKGTAVIAVPVGYLEPVVRGDRFWAVVRDELDVSYIMRGRLVKRDR
jgi:6-bladed beta-propeller protein